MLSWSDLNQQLHTEAFSHQRLLEIFERFTDDVIGSISAPGFAHRGMIASPTKDQTYFTISFAGRALRFDFSSRRNDKGSLVGNVRCSLVKSCPDVVWIPVGEFSFNEKGVTDLFEDGDGDATPITIDNDLARLYVALNFVHESTSK